ncbi:hypothetical protein ACSHWG_00815 [Leucobacter sp. Z1108]|uniref:hypothetical protein n=1 Tax=Leucobacter sp. Z1108 TaxID=3439066 RepID=UPI003F2ECE35
MTMKLRREWREIEEKLGELREEHAQRERLEVALCDADMYGDTLYEIRDKMGALEAEIERLDLLVCDYEEVLGA